MRLFAATLSVLLWAASASGRSIVVPVTGGKDVSFANLSTEQGLSAGHVVQILQDDRGFIWIGTSNGLNRYDGNDFKVFRHDPKDPNSLSGVFITALQQDRSGALWIGVDQSLDRLDPSTETIVHYLSNAKDKNSLAGPVEQICQDREGILWLATKVGLERLDPESGKFTHYRNDPDNSASLGNNDVRYTFEDRAGVLWIASATEVDAFDRRTGQFVRHPYSEAYVYDRIYEDHSGVLWLGASHGSGLAVMDRPSDKFVQYAFVDKQLNRPLTSAIRAIYEDADGILWLATIGDGLLKFNSKRTEAVQYRNDGNARSLNNNFLLALCGDREDNVWVGTYRGGVNRFSKKQQPFAVYRKEIGNPNSLDQSFVYSMFEDTQGILWMGTDQVNRIDPSTGRYTFYKHDGSDPNSISAGNVQSIVEDRLGTLWFATFGGGVCRFDRKTGRFKVYRHNPKDSFSLSRDSVIRLFVDHTGTLWVGTEDGLNRFDSKTERFEVYRAELGNPTANQYPAIAEDASGALWLGKYQSGLQRFDPATGKFTVYQHDPKHSSSLSNNRVNAIQADEYGKIWIGTQDGLNLLDPKTGAFTGYYERDGLPNNVIQGILQDARNNLWVSTGGGLSKFNLRSGVFKNYFAADGIASDEFNNYGAQNQTNNGQMFFGGVSGVTAFYPDQIVDLSKPPTVVLTDFRLFNVSGKVGPGFPLKKAIPYADAVSLSHQQGVFTLGFSALSYLNPKRNRYRYRLDGLEKMWNETDNERRFVTYTTLPAGDYTFRVQGSSNRGPWNEPGVAFRIHVAPAWWKTGWFLGFLCSLGLCLAWGVHHLRLRDLQKRHRELACVEAEINALNQRLINAQEEERRRIARELHDDFSQQIAALSMAIGNIRRQLPEQRPEARSQIDVVHRKLAELAARVRRISHELHPAILEYAGLAAALQAYCSEFTALTSVQVAYHAADGFDDLPRDVALCLYRVTQEALQNVAKHSTAKQAQVSLTRSSGLLSLTVEDHGAGATLRGSAAVGLGLVSMRERARLVNGTFQFHSEPNRGTTVMVGVPVGPSDCKAPPNSQTE